MKWEENNLQLQGEYVLLYMFQARRPPRLDSLIVMDGRIMQPGDVGHAARAGAGDHLRDERENVEPTSRDPGLLLLGQRNDGRIRHNLERQAPLAHLLYQEAQRDGSANHLFGVTAAYAAVMAPEELLCQLLWLGRVVRIHECRREGCMEFIDLLVEFLGCENRTKECLWILASLTISVLVDAEHVDRVENLIVQFGVMKLEHMFGNLHPVQISRNS